MQVTPEEFRAEMIGPQKALSPDGGADHSSVPELMALSEFSTAASSLLGQVAGVIKGEHITSLERVLFRATRGNVVFENWPPKK